MDEIKEAAVLNEEDLEAVSGGAGERKRIRLTGVYWATTFANTGANNLLIGASDLYIEYVSGAQGKAKYRILRYGTYMGWTIRENFVYM